MLTVNGGDLWCVTMSIPLSLSYVCNLNSHHKSSAVRLQSCNIFIHSKIGFIFISFEPFYTINGYTIWCPPSVLNISNGNLKLHIPEIDVNVNIHLITVVLQCWMLNIASMMTISKRQCSISFQIIVIIISVNNQ